MKPIIVYSSKYGATAQYAEWLAEKLRVPVYSTAAINTPELAAADVVIIGSSVYIGKLHISSWLQENKVILSSKKVFFFVVCANAGADMQTAQNAIITRNLPASLCKKEDVFFLPGRLDPAKVSWSDKLMLKIGAMFEPDPLKKNVMRHGIDGVAVTQVQAIVAAVSKYISPAAK